MRDGEIRNNTAEHGGGVNVGERGAFTMEGGTISGNSSSSTNSKDKIGGGGVYVGKKGAFTMKDGEISRNTANEYGGGVCVNAGGSAPGTFIKRGRSVIDATNSAPNGKVAYVYGSRDKQRNSAAGQGVNMDSRLSGSAGGWE
jgi:hypothetical protein